MQPTITCYDDFGESVSISGDTIAVSEDFGCFWSDPGAVHLFERDQGGPGKWGESKVIYSTVWPDEGFGAPVAIEGDMLVVGGSKPTGNSTDPVVFLYQRDLGGPGNWGLLTIIESRGSVLDLEGDMLAVGDPWWPAQGFVDLFERDAGGPGNWGLVTTLAGPGPYFGYVVQLSGDTLAVSEAVPGNSLAQPRQVHLFERNEGGPNAWGQVAVLQSTSGTTTDFYGDSLALDGDTLLVGARMDDESGSGDGAVYVYARDLGGPNAWGLASKRTTAPSLSTDGFGSTVALEGDLAVVGARTTDLGHAGVMGMAYDPNTSTLYGSTCTLDGAKLNELVVIDETTGLTTSVGPLGFDRVRALAFDPVSDTLYGADGVNDQLLTIDTSTGAATPVGPIGFNTVRGLAFDTSTGTLFAINTGSDQVLTIDPTTGAGTLLGTTGVNTIFEGLAYHGPTQTLYASDHKGKDLYVIDTATGAATLAVAGFQGFTALAVDGSNRLLATRGTELFRYAAGLSIPPSAVGLHGVFELGRAQVFEESDPVNYCTAGSSASGCQATIAASGIPSASLSSGFTLSTQNMEGDKNGLFFYGTNGRQANPWGNGTSYVCVVPPRWRGGLLLGSGTAGVCDGAFSQDLNARWCPSCPKPGHNPGAGALMQAQFWYRDPLNTSNQSSSMSDAVEFTVCP